MKTKTNKKSPRSGYFYGLGQNTLESARHFSTQDKISIAYLLAGMIVFPAFFVTCGWIGGIVS